MLRGFIELYKIEKDKSLLQLFITDGEKVWQQEKDENNLLGKSKAKRLIDQAAMLEIYARLQQIQK